MIIRRKKLSPQTNVAAQIQNSTPKINDEAAQGIQTPIEQPNTVPLAKKQQEPMTVPKPVDPMEEKLKEIETIDISEIEFKERFERRRGDRRRGYRRIDERTLVSRAQEEAKSIRELAAKEGYKSGLESAAQEIEKLKTSLEEFVGSKKAVYEEFSKDILEIAVEVAKKIIKKEVELNDDMLKNIISEVFDEISGSEEKITVKVAPDEVEFARASLPEVLSNSQIDAKIIVVPDENVEKGSCIVITGNGVIDANISTQLGIIQNAFGIYKGGQ